MGQSVKRRINGIANKNDAFELRKLLDAVLADLTELRTRVAALVADATDLTADARNKILTNPTLTIAGGKKTAESTTGFFYRIGQFFGYKPAGQDMSALVGTIADNKTAGWAFYVDGDANITTSAKTADADDLATAVTYLTAVAVPENKALIGYLFVSTAGATFVGGTTDLDAGTATDYYFSFMGSAIDPGAMTATTPAVLALEA